jgi:hypothetical protein
VNTDEPGQTFTNFVAKERIAIRARRAKLGLDDDTPLIGLALSGGGIRSATFCLGFLQALSACGFLKRIDYLSTVSGGSYIGSFLGALFVPPKKRGRGLIKGMGPVPKFDPEAPLQSDFGIEAVRRLREAGRYLTPTGTSDAFFGAAVVIRNWAAVQFVIGLMALFAFWTIRCIDWWLSGTIGQPSASVSCILSYLALGLLALVIGAASAYWLTRRDWIPGWRWQRAVSNLVFFAIMMMGAWISAPWWAPSRLQFLAPPANGLTSFLALTVALTLLLYGTAEFKHGAIDYSVPPDDQSPKAKAQRRKDRYNPQLLIAAEDKVRTALSRWMASALSSFLILVALLAIDSLAALVPAAIRDVLRPIRSLSDVWVILKNAWPLLVAGGTPLLSWAAHQRLKRQEQEARAKAEGLRPGSATPALLLAAGLGLLIFWLLFWSSVSHFAFSPAVIKSWGRPLILIVLILLNLGLSLSYSFINLSSLSTFYAARLRRAYIGASSYGRSVGSVGTDDPQDRIGLDEYYTAGPSNGAPAHIINVTIAETIVGTSNLVARDRKGKPMQITPAGIAYEADRPGEMIGQNRRWGEELPLANWVAISGAAVSAAIGSGTSIGTSILATMTNVRLGYWWKRDRARKAASLLWAGLHDTMQNYLFLELRGAFDGTRRRRWYLTDGGHFENSGIYALLQRQVRFIIACDNGADPEYQMADIVRLLGRARTDLGANIDFLDADQIKARFGSDSPLLSYIGPYAALAQRATLEAPRGPLAALAAIHYANGDSGLLLLVKPRLTLTEPPELLAYRSLPGCGDFPQQTTGDQFFDEAQWEAYRRLGELAGTKLFAHSSDPDGWLPVPPQDS